MQGRSIPRSLPATCFTKLKFDLAQVLIHTLSRPFFYSSICPFNRLVSFMLSPTLFIQATERSAGKKKRKKERGGGERKSVNV